MVFKYKAINIKRIETPNWHETKDYPFEILQSTTKSYRIEYIRKFDWHSFSE